MIEILKNDDDFRKWFLELYVSMDTDMEIKNKYMLPYVDLNIMEIRNNCIYSIAPVYVKALNQIYSLEKIRILT